MVGLSQIALELRPRCPDCRSKLDLTQFTAEVFAEILEKLIKGERVQISNFGAFTAKYTAAREITTFGGVKKQVDGRMVIRFRAAEKAKDKVNGRKDDASRSRRRRQPDGDRGRKSGGVNRPASQDGKRGRDRRKNKAKR